MASRHQRRKRAAAKKAYYELAREEAGERNGRDAIVRANLQELRSMTPEQKEEARIQQKADRAYRNSNVLQPARGGGSGGYLGAHTVIGPHTPEWFGKDSD
jgi:hypothetical protein